MERVEALYAGHSELGYPQYNLGFLHLTLGDPARARMYFERVLERESTGALAERVRQAMAELGR